MQEEEVPTIYHKIEAGKKIRVFKSVYNGRTYYKVQITQKNYDGTKDIFYIGVQFKKNVELEDIDGKGTDIIIKKAFENFRVNPSDKYNPILYLVITDFEVVERQEQIEATAYAEFNNNLAKNENNDLGIEYTIEENSDDELPF